GRPGVAGNRRAEAGSQVVDRNVQRAGSALGQLRMSIDVSRRNRLDGEHPDAKDDQPQQDRGYRRNSRGQHAEGGNADSNSHHLAAAKAPSQSSRNERGSYSREVDEVDARDCGDRESKGWCGQVEGQIGEDSDDGEEDPGADEERANQGWILEVTEQPTVRKPQLHRLSDLAPRKYASHRNRGH